MILAVWKSDMTDNAHERVSPTLLALLTPIVAALDVADTALLALDGLLPAPCFAAARIRTVLCATDDAAPAHRMEMVSAAVVDRVDVLMVRRPSDAGQLASVSVDVTLWRDGTFRLFWSMQLFRHSDGRLWLVPPATVTMASIRLGPDGLMPVTRPPYADVDERAAGLLRAAREIATILRSRAS